MQASYDSLLAEEGDEDDDDEELHGDSRVDEPIYPEHPDFALTWNGAQENPMYAIEETWNIDPNVMLTTNHAKNNMVGVRFCLSKHESHALTLKRPEGCMYGFECAVYVP